MQGICWHRPVQPQLFTIARAKVPISSSPLIRADVPVGVLYVYHNLVGHVSSGCLYIQTDNLQGFGMCRNDIIYLNCSTVTKFTIW